MPTLRSRLLHGCLFAMVGAWVASPAAAWNHALTVTTDYIAAGAVSTVGRLSPWPASPDLESVHSDASARWIGPLVYVVNHAGADNLQVLDPAQNFATVRQFSLGLGRGLRDIALDRDGEAYVSCYDTAELLRVDPETGQILGLISTAAFADQDGLPETGWMITDGDRLLLACERLDRDNWYLPVGESVLAVYDMVAEAWVDVDPGSPGVQGIVLAATNPYGKPVRAGDRILVPCVGAYGLLDGGVDVVDPAQLASAGLEVTEVQLGGDLIAVAGGQSGRRHVAISDASFTTSIRRYDPAGGPVAVLTQGTGYDHVDVAFDGDFQIFVSDRRLGAAGIRVFDAAGGAELTSHPLAVGLPPDRLVFPEPDPSTDLPELPPAQLVLRAPWPNPANPAANVSFAASPRSVVRLRVIDLRGREVRHAEVAVDAAGDGSWVFDGLATDGRPVASGVYRVVAETDGSFATRSLTLVR